MSRRVKRSRFVVAVAVGGFAAAALVSALPVGPLWRVVGVIFLGFVCVAMIQRYITQRVEKRLESLSRNIKRACEENLAADCETGEDSIGVLGSHVNALIRKITDLSVNVVDADRELQWAQKELRLKEELAERGKLLEATNVQLETRLKELSLLFSTSRILASSLELDPLIANFCEAGGRMLGVDSLAMMVWDEKSRSLLVKGTWGLGDAAYRVEGMRFTPGEGAAGMVFESRTMLYLKDIENDRRFIHFRGKLRFSGSALLLPLLAANQCVGVMLLFRAAKEAFSFEDVGLYHIIASQTAGAIANALLHLKTVELATHDELTGLYNRRMFETRLDMEWERARRFSHSLALIMIDVDHFKKFNDDHGHLVGDDVLRQTAAQLQRLVRRVDMVARFGGEEFTILLPRTAKPEAHDVAEKLRRAVETTSFFSEGEMLPFSVTISAGLASTQDEPATAKQLVDMADQALLYAKSTGRNRVVSFGSFQSAGL